MLPEFSVVITRFNRTRYNRTRYNRTQNHRTRNHRTLKLRFPYIPCNVYLDKCFKIAEWIELKFLFCSLNIEQIDCVTIPKFFIITKIGNVNLKGA